MKSTRRSFLKGLIVGLGSVATLTKFPFIQNAFAANADQKLVDTKKQGYVHDVGATAPVDPKFAAHKKQIADKKGTALPACHNCKQYKDPAGGYGTCAMVGATKGSDIRVHEKGWCKVWQIDTTKIS
jgi:hypothetical protein